MSNGSSPRNSASPFPISRGEAESITGFPEALRDAPGWKPAIWTFERGGRIWLVKDLRRTNPLYRFTWGRFVMRWEERIYRKIEGLPRIPSFPGRLDADALVFERLEGVPLHRSQIPALPAGFLDELSSWIAQLHERGVVHLDLRQKRNILIGPDGRPFIVDFGGAIYFGSAGVFRKLLFPLFAWIDRSAVVKYRVRYFHEQASEVEKKRDRRMNLMRRLWIFSPHKPRKNTPTRQP